MKIHEVINNDNWTKGISPDSSKSCLIFFIYKIYGFYGEGAKVCSLVKREMIERGMINPSGSPYEWNDKKERTIEEVRDFCKEMNI